MITYNGTILKVGSSWLGNEEPPVPPTPLNKHVVPIGMEAGQLLVSQYSEYIPSDPQHHLSSTTPVAAIVVDGGDGQPVLTTFGGFPKGDDYELWRAQGWPLLITQPDTLWSTAVTDIIATVEYAYLNNSNFTRYPDAGDWLMGKLRNCTSLNIIIDNDVTTFGGAFHGSMYSNVESLTISHKNLGLPTALTSLDNMFQNSDETSKLRVVDMYYMDLSYVSSMYAMCQYCASLERLLMFPTVLVDNLNDLSLAFQGCGNLKEWSPINVGETFSLPYIDNVQGCFHGCAILEADILRFYQQASARISSQSRYQNCFLNCSTSASSTVRDMRQQIPRAWGGDMS